MEIKSYTHHSHVVIYMYLNIQQKLMAKTLSPPELAYLQLVNNTDLYFIYQFRSNTTLIISQKTSFFSHQCTLMSRIIGHRSQFSAFSALSAFFFSEKWQKSGFRFFRFSAFLVLKKRNFKKAVEAKVWDVSNQTNILRGATSFLYTIV